MIKIIFPFKHGRDSEVAKAANRVVGSAKSNAAVFTDTARVQALETKLSAFQVALNDAADGSRTLIAIKKEARKALIEEMVQFSYYTLQVCKGDRAMLLSSGFDVTKELPTARLLSTINGLMVTNEKPGEVKLQATHVKGARAFIHQYTAEPPSASTVWVSETTAHRKHTFTGLTPLTTYWFRVIAIGLNGQSVIADPVSRVIL